ncbi:MAG: hypothetical protein JSW73_02170 [Candidatus Woesearchaeota archaeon]|nr:MAG: hypothetical protein JSW73_02170 [Candidatus Woesearchaeota archaeon]
MSRKKSLEKRLKFVDPLTKGILPIVKTAKVDKNNYCAKFSNNNNHYKQAPKRNYKRKL